MSKFSDMEATQGAPTEIAGLFDGLTPDQARAARLPGAVLVLAGAGTGKTRTLTAGVAARIGVRGIPPPASSL